MNDYKGVNTQMNEFLESAEYWSDRNGYEQEALHAMLEILKVLVKERETMIKSNNGEFK